MYKRTEGPRPLLSVFSDILSVPATDPNAVSRLHPVSYLVILASEDNPFFRKIFRYVPYFFAGTFTLSLR